MRWQAELGRAAQDAGATAARWSATLARRALTQRNRAALLGTLALVLMVAGATWAIWHLSVPPAPRAPIAVALEQPRTSPDGRPRLVPRHAEEPGRGLSLATTDQALPRAVTSSAVPALPDAVQPLAAIPPAPAAPPLPSAPRDTVTPVTAGLPPEPAQPAAALAAEVPPVALAQPPWRANAVPVSLAPGQPMIAIVIDDLGPTHGPTLKAIALPGPLTLAFLPYAGDLPNLTGKARANGHELMIHLPMEPIDLRHNNPGPQALLTTLTTDEVRQRLDWALGRFDGYVGINNHMGSAFSTWEPGLAVVMQDLHEKGLLFLDSRTIGNSRAESMALAYGVPAAGRDIFLDNEYEDPAAIWAQLRVVERLALKRGSAIAIGHPHPATLAALAQWLPEVQARGFVLVPISALVETDPTAGHLVQASGQGGELR